MVDIDVRSDELRSQATAVKDGAGQVDEVVKRLTGQIRELANRWRGGASDSFQSLWQDWQQGASQLHEAMAGIGALLDHAAQTYENAEDSIRQSASSR